MTKIIVDTEGIDKKVTPVFDKCTNLLDKSLELTKKFNIPKDYKYKEEILTLISDLENYKNDLDSYNKAYSKASTNYTNLNNNMLEQIKSIKNIDIYKN